jgi:hypothetical protein
VTNREDEVVKETFVEHRRSWGTDEGKLDTIQRKPVPSAQFTEPKNELQHPLPKIYPHFEPSPSQPTDDVEPEIDPGIARRFQLKSHDGSSTISRKPVGPRPFQSRLKTASSEVIERKPVGGSGGLAISRPRAWTELPTQLPSSDVPGDKQLQSDAGDIGPDGQLNAVPRSVPDAVFIDDLPAPPLPPRPSYANPEDRMEEEFHVTISGTLAAFFGNNDRH